MNLFACLLALRYLLDVSIRGDKHDLFACLIKTHGYSNGLIKDLLHLCRSGLASPARQATQAPSPINQEHEHEQQLAYFTSGYSWHRTTTNNHNNGDLTKFKVTRLDGYNRAANQVLVATTT